MMRHLGQIGVSGFLITEALHMPATSKIVGASWDAKSDRLTFVVEDDALPAIAEGDVAPVYVPEITHHPERYEWDWKTTEAPQ